VQLKKVAGAFGLISQSNGFDHKKCLVRRQAVWILLIG
jgi:hypothetical protein